jgi:hypothetical protein
MLLHFQSVTSIFGDYLLINGDRLRWWRQLLAEGLPKHHDIPRNRRRAFPAELTLYTRDTRAFLSSVPPPASYAIGSAAHSFTYIFTYSSAVSYATGSATHSLTFTPSPDIAFPSSAASSYSSQSHSRPLKWSAPRTPPISFTTSFHILLCHTIAGLILLRIHDPLILCNKNILISPSSFATRIY